MIKNYILLVAIAAIVCNGCKKESTISDQNSPSTTPSVTKKKKTNSIEYDLMMAYSDGYQHGYGLAASIPSAQSDIFNQSMTLWMNNHPLTSLSASTPDDLKLNIKADTVSFTTHGIGFMKTAAMETVYWINSGLSTYIDSYTMQYITNHSGNDLFSNVARIGFFDGAHSTTGTDYRRSIIIDGAEYIFPWNDNCNGCSGF